MDREERQKIIQELAGKHFSGVNHPVPGRAETPAQKQEILTRLAEIWGRNPSMRFGQLLINAVNERTDLYYVEDYVLTETVEAHYDRG